MNLLSNAQKFTSKRKGLIEVTSRTKTLDDE